MLPLTTSADSPSLSRSTILRTLRGNLVGLSMNHPYREARVRRMIDQLQYVIQDWPSSAWPACCEAGHPLPKQAEMLAQLGQLSESPVPVQQLLAMVLLLLEAPVRSETPQVPFQKKPHLTIAH